MANVDLPVPPFSFPKTTTRGVEDERIPTSISRFLENLKPRGALPQLDRLQAAEQHSVQSE